MRAFGWYLIVDELCPAESPFDPQLAEIIQEVKNLGSFHNTLV